MIPEVGIFSIYVYRRDAKSCVLGIRKFFPFVDVVGTKNFSSYIPGEVIIVVLKTGGR